MKRYTIFLLLVFSIPLFADFTNRQLSCPPDQTRVHTGIMKTHNYPALQPVLQLLDDSSLLPKGSTTNRVDHARANELMQQSRLGESSTGIRFQENKGQIVDTDGKTRNDIAFIANAPGARLYFRNDGISYVFIQNHPCPDGHLPLAKSEGLFEGETERGSETESYRLDMTLIGSNPDVRVRAEGELPGYVNYYLPHCPDGITGIKEYSRIVYENVYDNVDLELFSSNGKMKYNFIVRPGGNVSDIRMKYDGDSEASLTSDGSISVGTPLGRIEEVTPYTYSGDESNEVSSRFLRKGNTVSFAVDEYDQSQTLVIDPWATYFGGSGYENTTGIASDASGNLIICGSTQSTNFPATVGAFQTTLSGIADGYIAKLNASGQRVWATYYGGSTREWANDVAVDGAGNLVIGGSTTSTNFPVTAGAFQTANRGGADAFVLKLDASGARIWATYLGGSKDERSDIYPGSDVAVDAGNNIVIIGSTVSTDFPVTSGAFQTKKATGATNDAFVAKFTAAGARVWATYYGGKTEDRAYDVTIDSQNNVIFTGTTGSSNFPISSGAFQTSTAEGSDAFIVKLTASGARSWATYCGGGAYDEFKCTTVDAADNIYLAGWSASTNFPVTAGVFQTTSGGGNDAIVVKFNSGGGRVWASYFGGNGGDEVDGIAIDAGGSVVIAGYGSSTNLPVVNALQSAYAGGNTDSFVAKFNSTFTTTVWSTYYGGTGSELTSNGVAKDANGNLAFVGNTTSTNFPVYSAWQSTLGGSYDGFVVQLNTNGQFFKRSVEYAQLPSTVTLEQNYPNPFNPSTTISFSIPEEMSVCLSVYDAVGREVDVLIDGILTGGHYQRQWSADHHSSTGMYTVRFVARDADGKEIVLQRQMILTK